MLNDFLLNAFRGIENISDWNKKKQRIPIYSCKIQTERGPSERLLRDKKKHKLIMIDSKP